MEIQKLLTILVIQVVTINIYAVSPAALGSSSSGETFSIHPEKARFIPNIEERKEQKVYAQFIENWQDIPLILEGEVVNQKLVSAINTSRWSKGLSLDKIFELSVRTPHLFTDGVKVDEATLVSPFGETSYSRYVTLPVVLGIRFKGKNDEGKAAAIKEGTRETLIEINIVFERFEDRELTEEVKFNYIKNSGSWWLEVLGEKLGLINEFDDNFVESVALMVIENHFSKEKNKNWLIDTFQGLRDKNPVNVRYAFPKISDGKRDEIRVNGEALD